MTIKMSGVPKTAIYVLGDRTVSGEQIAKMTPEQLDHLISWVSWRITRRSKGGNKTNKILSILQEDLYDLQRKNKDIAKTTTH